MKVIGAGLGRTGTMSLRVALCELGFGPCHHMKEVIGNLPQQVPAWENIVAGTFNWSTVYDGFTSAVDWPTASFYEQLAADFPQAKFILTHRNPETWAASISETILTALGTINDAPPEIQRWMRMCISVLAMAGISLKMSTDELIEAFCLHNDKVKKAIPKERLLVFEVKEGWQPLCEFLKVDVPEGDFPRTNDREEFFRLVKGEE